MEYEILRSHRRTMALEVRRDGSVLVRAPQFVSQRAITQFVESHEAWLIAKQEKQRLHANAHPEPTPEQEKQYRKLAHERLPQKVMRWAKIIGVQPTALHITSARTRFGSCSGKNGISFSWRLMQYPDEAVEYVVVHELCHILHHDHSAAFWAAVEQYMPDYRARQKLLKIG